MDVADKKCSTADVDAHDLDRYLLTFKNLRKVVKPAMHDGLIGLTNILTVLEHNMTALCDDDGDDEIPNILEKHETVDLLMDVTKCTDIHASHLAVKVLTIIFTRYPRLFDNRKLLYEIREHSRFDVINKLLCVVRKKMMFNHCDGEQLISSSPMYENLLRDSLTMYSAWIRSVVNGSPMTSINDIVDVLYGVKIQLKICWIIGQSKALKELFVAAYSSLVIALKSILLWLLRNADSNVVFDLNAVNQTVWLRISKCLLVISKIATDNQNWVSELCQNTCAVILKAFLTPEIMCSLSVHKSCFGGMATDFRYSAGVCLNDCSFRRIVLFQLSIVYTQYCRSRNEEDLQFWLNNIFSLLHKFPEVDKTENVSKLLMNVFFEQDDELAAMLSVLLQVYVEISKEQETTTYTKNSRRLINPFLIVHELLRELSFDENVLLDWLLSSESKFFEYLRRFLQFFLESFDDFVETFPYTVNERRDSQLAPAFHMLNLTAGMDSKPTAMTPVLVEYSSSEDEQVTRHFSESAENIMSCLIRLYLKLERMVEQNLLDDKIRVIVTQLEQLQILYET